VQILHSFAGSIQQYAEEISDADRYRPEGCPQCQAKSSLAAHGFYSRTLVDVEFEGTIRVRRYLCRKCKRTVSLLPEFVLPHLRFSVAVISSFLGARLLEGRTLRAAAQVAAQPDMPYQRGQFWIRRFRSQAVALAGALAGLMAPPPAADFLTRALQMLHAIGGLVAHRFLFGQLRIHLLGWPPFLAPAGHRLNLRPGAAAG